MKRKTLLDEFASDAMIGILAGRPMDIESYTAQKIARLAYIYAAAMVAERENYAQSPLEVA